MTMTIPSTGDLRAVLVKEADSRVDLAVAKAEAYRRYAGCDLRVTEINHKVALKTAGLQRVWEYDRIEVELMWLRLGVLPPGWSNRTTFVADSET